MLESVILSFDTLSKKTIGKKIQIFPTFPVFHCLFLALKFKLVLQKVFNVFNKIEFQNLGTCCSVKFSGSCLCRDFFFFHFWRLKKSGWLVVLVSFWDGFNMMMSSRCYIEGLVLSPLLLLPRCMKINTEKIVMLS